MYRQPSDSRCSGPGKPYRERSAPGELVTQDRLPQSETENQAQKPATTDPCATLERIGSPHRIAVAQVYSTSMTRDVQKRGEQFLAALKHVRTIRGPRPVPHHGADVAAAAPERSRRPRDALRDDRPASLWKRALVQRTPLYEKHVALGARMTEFGGWEMPVWYTGIQDEHNAVRQAVGLFDVSHMGEFVVYGAGALDFLRRVLTNDPGTLQINQAQYTLLPNLTGGTVDDLLCYKLDASVYLLVVNASNIEKDFAWLEGLREPSVKLDDRSSDKALLAVQGPAAIEVLRGITSLDVRGMDYYHFDRGDVGGKQALVSRTGYTGEDGFEIMTESADAPAIWDALMAAGAPHGIVPAGLGARDTLRLEAAFPLYGHELDDETSAIEAGLSFCVKLDKPAMVGAARLRSDKAEGPQKRLVGLEMTDRGIPRQGYSVMHDGAAVGIVTSGTMSPTLEIPIAMAYVPPSLAAVGTELAVSIRGSDVPARVVKRPFYRRPA